MPIRHEQRMPKRRRVPVDLGDFILDRGGATDVGDLLLLDRGGAAPTGSEKHVHRYLRPRRRRRPLMTVLRIALAGVGTCFLLLLLITPLGWKEQAIAGSLLIACAVLLSGMSRSHGVTLALMMVSLFSTARYGYWRSIETWKGITSAGHIHQWDTLFVLLLLGAEFYAFATLALGYFQTLRPLRRQPLRLSGDPRRWPSVDVLIPTYNEPLDVVRATVLGALALDYPQDRLNVIVLDDGRRKEFEDWTAQVGAGYITRGDNAHAKAGNINHALQQTDGEYVAIFDSDHVPTRSFLQATLGWFARDHRLGLVQTPHHFYSPDPFERNLGQFRKIPNEGALFHRLVQDGNDLWNASFFCGSCAVLRRRALEEIGGLAVETVTEDAHTALRLQCQGWNTAYINIPQAAGLATESLSAHIGQRIRWARGMVQILRRENPLFARGLSFAQRLCYFNATTHFLFAAPRLIFLTVPLTYLLFGIVNIYGYSLAVFAYALPHIALSQLTNARIQKGFRSSFWNEIYEAVLAPYILLPTLLALINPRLGRFNVTAKGGVVERSYFDHRVALPLLLLLGLNIAGLVMAYQRFVADPAHRDTVIMNAVWTSYNVVILLVAASVALEKRQRRADVRVDVHVPLTLVTREGLEISGVSGELSRGGMTAHLEQRAQLQPQSIVNVWLHAQRTKCRVAARVVSIRGSELHLLFSRLDTRQECFLVNMMYSRPDAWLAWNFTGRDSPLRSLWRIAWLSLRGVLVVTGGLLMPFRRRNGNGSAKSRRRAAAAAASGVVLCMLATPQRVEGAQRRATADVVEPSMFHDSYTLREIAGQSTTTLRGRGAQLNFYFGVPVTKIISVATLGLRYSAPLLAHDEARLELLLNGTPIQVIELVPGADLRSEISLHTDLLNTDNTLSLRLLGSCAACDKTRAPWVIVDPGSNVDIGGTRLSLANDLALLPIPFFDPSSQREGQLPVVFSDTPSPDEVNAAVAVASWFGVASDVRGVRFPVKVGTLPEGNGLVIARRGSALEASLALPDQPATVVAIRNNPRDPYGKLLIVAGPTAADLLTAARAFVLSDVSRVHSDAAGVTGINVPARREYDAPRWLQTDRPAAIGLYTSADRLKLTGSGSINIYFRLPPDLFLAAQQSVPLRIRFDYSGVAEGAEAALHVRLNEQDVDTIRLPSTSTAQRAETVWLPTGRMRVYTNTLTVDVDFGHSDPPAGVSRYLAIHRESSIDLGGLPHSVVLPRLELVVDAGYPFTAWSDLSRTAVVLSASPTETEYEALLNMVGFFGAQTGAPVTAVDIVEPADVQRVRDRDLIVLGTPESQPLLSLWANAMPFALSADGVRIHSLQEVDLWLRPTWPFREDDRDRLAALAASGARMDVILEHFVSPFRPDRSVVAIVPGDANGSQAAATFTAARKGPVYGGVAVARDGRFESFLVGTAAYHSGSVDPVQRTRVMLVEHFWLISPAVMVVALVIGRVLHGGMERVAARRLRVESA
jgi:cellulose synthase (UDP-forming)